MFLKINDNFYKWIPTDSLKKGINHTGLDIIFDSISSDDRITALNKAVCNGHFDIVKLLVSNGADVKRVIPLENFEFP